jgi:PelA/Pel-15E family pectate lyase
MRHPARCRAGSLILLAIFTSTSACSSSHPTPTPAPAATAPTTAPTVSDLTGPNPYLGPGPRFLRVIKLVDEPDAWFETDKGRRIVDNIVGWQNPNGGWFKNYDPRKPRPTTMPINPHDGPEGDDDVVWHAVSTFDNDATHTELRIIARAYRMLKDPRYRDSFERGLNYIFESQYANGGWPQRFPLQENYGRYITFNDNAMTDNVTLLQDIIAGKPDFFFVSDAERARCQESFNRAIDCILKCQVVVNGTLTVWCQQHDEVTFEPRGARNFELPGLSGQESVDLVLILMRIQNPDARVKRAVEAAVAWYKTSEIMGKRWVVMKGSEYFQGRDRALIDDPSAPPLWARYYDVQTNQPFFSGRDGHEKPSVDMISWERRNGYGWYGRWGDQILSGYQVWKTRADGAQ